MNNLPYLDPNRELYLNLGLLIIILDGLALTKRNKLVLTIDKIQVFIYLISKPVLLNQVLDLAGKKQVTMEDKEFHNVASISSNVDALFDRQKIKLLMGVLSNKKLIQVSYIPKTGFLFELNTSGKDKSKHLNNDYFTTVRKYVDQLKLLQSISIGKLNGYLNSVLKSGLSDEQ